MALYAGTLNQKLIVQSPDIDKAASTWFVPSKSKLKLLYGDSNCKSLGIKDDSDVYNKVKDSVRQSLIMAYQKTRGIDNKEQRATKIIEILSNEYAWRANKPIALK